RIPRPPGARACAAGRACDTLSGMSFWSWLGLDGRGATDGLGGGGDIGGWVSGLDPKRAHFIACFAYILTRGARADQQITDGEAPSMERLVAERVGIPPE